MMAERSNRKTVPKSFVPDAVLLTHAHIGHYTGLMFYGYLVRYNSPQKKGKFAIFVL
ncbi:hypothetical protein KGY73_07870 [bacterium]|nr:hypothetical protein [bacterium]